MNIVESSTYKKEIQQAVRAISDVDFNILVTGASGLIGSCLVDILLYASRKKNIKVFALGRNTEKMRERFSYANNGSIIFVSQDVSEPLGITEQIDYIIHAASNADPVSYSFYPTETIITNVYGTNNMLKYCKEHPRTRLLLTSSFEAYGKIEGQDVYREEDSGEIDLNAIRSSYPESKRCAEILMRCHQKEYGTDCVIARLSSVYGPTMDKNDSKAHAQFIRNGMAGDNVVLKSRGEQKRTYCYLMDAVTGILTILFKGRSGEAYNVSNEKSIVSIADFAKTVAHVCGTGIVYDIPNEVEQQGYSRPQNCILDNNKLRDLGWEGRYFLREGIMATIDILREISC